MTPALTVDQARELGDDLLRQLADHIGDPAGIEDELQRWLGLLGVPAMAQVCLATVLRTFSDCLTPTTRDDWPDHGPAFIPKEGTR